MVVSKQFEVLKISRQFELLQFELLEEGEAFSEKNSFFAGWNRGDHPGDFLRSSPPHRSEKEGWGGDCPEEKSLIEVRTVPPESEGNRRGTCPDLKEFEGIQQKLLSGETPQLGAANLQEIVKRLSEKNGIGIRSVRILEPKEMNVYLKVSLHVDFNPISSMLGLGQFIYDIEHHEKELMISEMDFLVFNPRMPSNVQGSLIITGLMKKTKTKEKGRQG